jgi:hypothetical protein
MLQAYRAAIKMQPPPLMHRLVQGATKQKIGVRILGFKSDSAAKRPLHIQVQVSVLPKKA